MKAENDYIRNAYGTIADMPKPRYYATLKRGNDTRTYGPMTSTEWAKLIEQERAEGWELVGD